MRQDAKKLEEARVAVQAVAGLESQVAQYDAMERKCKKARLAAGCAGAEALLG